jgi:hypothetical protein
VSIAAANTSPAESGRLRLAAAACVVGGLIWAIDLTYEQMAGLTSVLANRAAFYSDETGFILSDVLLLVGILGLWWAGAAAGRLGTAGIIIAVIGRLVFIAAELNLTIAYTGFSPLLPLGALLSGIGMVVTGIAVLRARRWRGWRSVTPLLVGIYPFFAMLPLLVITQEASDLAIAGWGLVWSLMGVAQWYRATG